MPRVRAVLATLGERELTEAREAFPAPPVREVAVLVEQEALEATPAVVR